MKSEHAVRTEPDIQEKIAIIPNSLGHDAFIATFSVTDDNFLGKHTKEMQTGSITVPVRAAILLR